MVTITIDEATLNATRAALDLRVAHLEHEVSRYQHSQSELTDADPDWRVENIGRALVWNIAALHETRMAQEFYAELEPGTPEQADPITAALSWHDWQAVGPR